MDPRDIENVRFIMSLNEQEFELWASKLSEDDIEYAIQIVKQARTELVLKNAEHSDDIKDTSDAMKILKGFML